MRLGYADPPYPGMAAKHYRHHPDFAGEVDHVRLLHQLHTEFDGWVLHTGSSQLPDVIRWADRAGVPDARQVGQFHGYRVMSWIKPFAAMKPGVPVGYTWEPVLVKAARRPIVSGRIVMRDHLEEPEFENDAVRESIAMRRGLSGVKPDRVCRWAFEMMGATAADVLVDMFPGSGAVTFAWARWRADLLGTFDGPGQLWAAGDG